jgi:hypothetical protein
MNAGPVMEKEIFLYIVLAYLGVLVLLGVISLCNLFFDALLSQSIKHKAKVYRKKQVLQLQRLTEGQQLSIKHLKYFQRAFKHHRNLQAFDLVFNELSNKDKKQA